MKATWKVILDGSKHEALLAVDLYNQTRQARRLEGFFVHMHLAWLYLFQARYRRDGLTYFYKAENGRFVRVDGEKKSWDLTKFSRERWPENDPVRKNLELTIALRNKIEHRYEEAISLATAGYAQALLLNFEEELTTAFGGPHSLSGELRFPVFVGTFTTGGARRLALMQQGLPKAMSKFLDEFRASLDESVASDQRYECRLNVVPKLSPKDKADLALTYVRESDLTPDQWRALEQLDRTGTVIVKEQLREALNTDRMKPKKAAKRIEEAIPFRFVASTHFPRAWKALSARPKPGDAHPERTRVEFCIYDTAHDDYLYTEAFVKKVVEKTSTAKGFRFFLGLTPKLKAAHPGSVSADEPLTSTPNDSEVTSTRKVAAKARG